MGFTTLSLGLTLTIPTTGSRNWGTTLQSTTWTKISNHQHTGSPDGNKMVTASLTDNCVTTAKLSKNIGVTQYSSTLAPSGTTQTIDFSNGNVQNLSLGSASGNVTLTLSNPTLGATYLVWVSQGATARTLVWPASVKWPQGIAPILSTTNGDVDAIWLYCVDATTPVYRAWWEVDWS